MSFISQTARIFDNTAEFKFQAVVFGRNALYLEGAKPVKIDGGEMIFRTRNTLITVTGEGLAVKDIADDCVCLTGKIDGFIFGDL